MYPPPPPFHAPLYPFNTLILPLLYLTSPLHYTHVWTSIRVCHAEESSPHVQQETANMYGTLPRGAMTDRFRRTAGLAPFSSRKTGGVQKLGGSGSPQSHFTRSVTMPSRYPSPTSPPPAIQDWKVMVAEDCSSQVNLLDILPPPLRPPAATLSLSFLTPRGARQSRLVPICPAC